MGGTASGADQDAVVVLSRFVDGQRVGLCTATLVAPNLVVTARHCVSVSDAVAGCSPEGTPVAGAGVHEDYPPSSLAFYVAKSGAVPDTTNESLASAHGQALAVDASTTICNHDVAFVVLDEKLAAPIAPIRLGPPAGSDVLTAVGFGIVETGTLPTTRMKRTNVTMLGQGPMPFPDDATYGAGAAEVVLGESACSGDSGSPIVAATGAVVGVASRAGNGKPRDPNNAASICVGDTAHAVYTHLGESLDLVKHAFDLASATPWIEGQPDPRAPKPEATPTGPTPGGEPPHALPPAPPSADEPLPGSGTRDDASAGGGCSIQSAREDLGCVEQAVGAIALVAFLFRLRRRS